MAQHRTCPFDDRGIRRCPDTILVTRWVGIVSAARRGISTCGSRADGSSTDAYRYSTGYGRATGNASAIGSTTIGSTTMNAAVIAREIMLRRDMTDVLSSG